MTLPKMAVLLWVLVSAIVLAVGLLVPPVAVAAAPPTLYVAQGGANNADCSVSDPCATVSWALTHAVAGATIEVSGTVDDHVIVSTAASSPSPITISGADALADAPAVLDGSLAGTVVTIGRGVTVTLDEVRVEGGSNGGINNYGSLDVRSSTVTGTVHGHGIANVTGDLTVLDSTVSGNANVDSPGSGGYGVGGGISTRYGTVTISHSTISGNSANGGAAVYSRGGTVALDDSVVSANTDAGQDAGGGIENIGAALAITNSTVSDNTGNGGIENSGGTFTLAHSTVMANSGGIENADAHATIADSTIWGNSAGSDSKGGGGGIGDDGGSVTVVNSTVTGNTDSGTLAAGGIGTYNSIVDIIDSTITDNTAPNGAGGLFSSYYTGGTVTVGATILAANNGKNCGSATGSKPVSVGYNLTDDATGAPCGFTAATDIVDQAPDLGALGRNGGPTETMLPTPLSAATDVIPLGTTLVGVSVCPGTDQRSYARPRPGQSRCTIGAAEVVGTTRSTRTTVSVSPPSVTLGGMVIYLATVAPTSGSGYPTGTVSFTSGTTALCTATVSGGAGACAVANAPLGTDTITGTFHPGLNYKGSTGTATLTVHPPPPDPTTTSVRVTPQSVPLGSPVVFEAAVAASGSSVADPTGTVLFAVGSTEMCSAVLSGGVGACGSSRAPVGTDKVTGTYLGNAADARSSGSTTLTVMAPAVRAGGPPTGPPAP